jgi:hypothetical protein
VNKRERPEIGRVEKAIRFGCGALLGLFVGLYFIAKWSVMSIGVAVTVWGAAILICAYLAMKYGDEFWYGMFGRNK